jgi:hypothetical protein
MLIRAGAACHRALARATFRVTVDDDVAARRSRSLRTTRPVGQQLQTHSASPEWRGQPVRESRTTAYRS